MDSDNMLINQPKGKGYIHQAFDVGLKSRKTKRENAPFSVAVNMSLESKYCGNKQSRDPEGPPHQSRER